MGAISQAQGSLPKPNFRYAGKRRALKNSEEMNRAVEMYADMVRRICLVHLKNKHDMEDIIETVPNINANRTCLEAHKQSKNTEGTNSGDE